MRKFRNGNKLTSIATLDALRAYRASGFSLVELIVALGILVLMFALAGQVFNFTVQSTGEATALVEINQQLRALEQRLRDDLAFVQQGSSLLLIQGNPVNAYWTRDDRENDDDGDPSTGYPRPSDPEREYPRGSVPAPIPPRADLLMFFTARRANSYTDPSMTADLQQVVYGHAELGEYVAPPSVSGSATFEFQGVVSKQGAETSSPMFPVDVNQYPSPTTVCRVPASAWHLARRGVLIAPTYSPRVNPPGLAPTDAITLKPVTRLDDRRLLDGTTDIIAWFQLPDLREPIRAFDVDQDVLRPAIAGEFHLPEAPVFGSWQLPRIFAQSMKPYARSMLDVTPPPALAHRLGHYLLPNCASFKVEWTLSPRSSFVAGRLDGMTDVLWFDPGYVRDENQFRPHPGTNQDDPLRTLADTIQLAARDRHDDRERNLRSLLDDPVAHPDGTTYGLASRFRSDRWNSDYFTPIGSDGRANTIAFVAHRTHATTGELVPDDIFPSALRITVDVFDREGRLKRPIRHVMVIPVGR